METFLGVVFAIAIFGGGGWYILDRKNRKRGGPGLGFPGGSNVKKNLR